MAIYPLLVFGICVGGFPFCCNVSEFPFTLPFAPTEKCNQQIFAMLNFSLVLIRKVYLLENFNTNINSANGTIDKQWAINYEIIKCRTQNFN